jgi:hypothetical protein
MGKALYHLLFCGKQMGFGSLGCQPSNLIKRTSSNHPALGWWWINE